VTVPVEKAAVEQWLKDDLQPADRHQVLLDTVPGYGTAHPVMVEFDSFHSCKTAGTFLPYPDFNEVATMIPYVRWQNKTGVHFQPWSIVDNIWGGAAMMLTGSRHTTESAGGAQYPALPANWGQWTASGDSVLRLKNAHVESLTNASSLATVDVAWAEMLNLKHTKSITYDKCAASSGAWKYSCNTIKWEVSQAAKLTTGILDTTQGSTKYFPVSIKGDIVKLAAQFPGLEAYAVTTTMTAVIGCGEDAEIIV
jgi:hypothetical protein